MATCTSTSEPSEEEEEKKRKKRKQPPKVDKKERNDAICISHLSRAAKTFGTSHGHGGILTKRALRSGFLCRVRIRTLQKLINIASI